MQQQTPHSRRFSSRVATPGDGCVRVRSPASRWIDEKASRILLDFEVSNRRTPPASAILRSKISLTFFTPFGKLTVALLISTPACPSQVRRKQRHVGIRASNRAPLHPEC